MAARWDVERHPDGKTAWAYFPGDAHDGDTIHLDPDR
jgi:hypothetical protein